MHNYLKTPFLALAWSIKDTVSSLLSSSLGILCQLIKCFMRPIVFPSQTCNFILELLFPYLRNPCSLTSKILDFCRQGCASKYLTTSSPRGVKTLIAFSNFNVEMPTMDMYLLDGVVQLSLIRPESHKVTMKLRNIVLTPKNKTFHLKATV